MQLASPCRHPFREADDAEATAVRGLRELGAAVAVVGHGDLQTAGGAGQADGDLRGVGGVPAHVGQRLLDDPEGRRLDFVRQGAGHRRVAVQNAPLDGAREALDQVGDAGQITDGTAVA
ncbi:hypothetical protein GCM10010309_05380 [Streptomyces violaceochromogenes]|uniref:Uncharacterized protein n=1 Tax=Streptomyces collinus TaxID=42684 RepID=A0AA89TKU1_STRCU|nr:hypothetical protein [Streptomyces collinus]GHC49575.1 hypothetical protein GCM10010309_05380 [Streptomyces violaceochromogenes]